jgi:hypothetical protein
VETTWKATISMIKNGMKENIKMYLREADCGGVIWIEI